jgi:hypothetical protein
MLMLKKTDGFAALEFLFALVVLIALSGAGYYVYHFKKSTPITSTSSVSPHTIKTITQPEAFLLLKEAYKAQLATAQKECATYDKNCLTDSLVAGDKAAIAKAYGISDQSNDTIYFGLQKGKSLDVGGIGIGSINNKTKLAINDTSWYWEIGACSTNNRIFIEAETGATTGIHSWTYCSHNIDELSMLN